LFSFNILSANVEYTPLWRLIQAKSLKNGLGLFERGENLLQNGMFHFVFTLSQSPEIALQR